jgi:cytochrome c-type biogenesis protein CcmH
VKRLFLPVSLLLLTSHLAFAVPVDVEALSDPAIEMRARVISKGLRCLVCQNQSIDESDAPLAHDLRRLVRERVKSGDSDDQVRAFLVARYGDWILLDPPFNARTALLWSAPGIIAIGSAALIFLAWRRRKKTAQSDLTAAETKRLVELLDDVNL